MTKAQFISISKKGITPKFSQLIGLTESFNTSLLIDFCVMAHPNVCKTSHGSKCTVHTGNFGISYTLYNNGILKTNLDTNKKIFYPF